MRTPDMIAIAAALAIAIAGGLWLFEQSQTPQVTVDNTPPVTVPVTHPPATGGNGEPPNANEPQPEEPTDVVPIEPPVPSGGKGEEPTGQPEPVVPPATDETDHSVPPTPAKKPPVVYPNIEHKPIIVQPHKTKVHKKKKPDVGHNTGIVPPWMHPKPRSRKHYYCKEFCVAYKDHGYYYKLTPHNDW